MFSYIVVIGIIVVIAVIILEIREKNKKPKKETAPARDILKEDFERQKRLKEEVQKIDGINEK